MNRDAGLCLFEGRENSRKSDDYTDYPADDSEVISERHNDEQHSFCVATTESPLKNSISVPSAIRQNPAVRSAFY